MPEPVWWHWSQKSFRGLTNHASSMSPSVSKKMVTVKELEQRLAKLRERDSSLHGADCDINPADSNRRWVGESANTLRRMGSEYPFRRNEAPAAPSAAAARSRSAPGNEFPTALDRGKFIRHAQQQGLYEHTSCTAPASSTRSRRSSISSQASSTTAIASVARFAHRRSPSASPTTTTRASLQEMKEQEAAKKWWVEKMAREVDMVRKRRELSFAK
jgi:hypothetical protein